MSGDLNSLLVQEHALTIARQEKRIQKLEEANIQSNFLLFAVLAEQKNSFINSLETVASIFKSLPIGKKPDAFNLLYPTFQDVLNKINDNQYSIVCDVTLDFCFSMGELKRVVDVSLPLIQKLIERLKNILNKNVRGGENGEGLIKDLVLCILPFCNPLTFFGKAFEIYCYVLAKRNTNSEPQVLDAIRFMYGTMNEGAWKSLSNESKVVSIYLDLFREYTGEIKERSAIVIGFLLSDQDLTKVRIKSYSVPPQSNPLPKFPVYSPRFPKTTPVAILGFLNNLALLNNDSWQCNDSRSVINLLKKNPNNSLVLDSMK